MSQERSLTPEVQRNVTIAPESSTSLRDLLAMAFRHRQLLLRTFLVIMVAAVLAGVLLSQYESEMKILVKHERVDPLVSAEDNGPAQPVRVDLTEQEVNSEVEILRSADLLQKVVVTVGLDKNVWLWSPDQWFASAEDKKALRIAKAADKLDDKLSFQPIRRSNLLVVRYANRDPELAHRVLRTLSDLYLEKHVAVNRLPEQFGFFSQQADEYKRGLEEAETRLATFNREAGVTAPEVERDKRIERLAAFQAELETTRAAISENRTRSQVLAQQVADSPERVTTQVKTLNNPQLLEQLKSTLLELELKRTELLAKFAPTYRPVQEIEQKIVQTKASIEREEKNPMRDETTDRDPAYEWVRGELAKSKSELRALTAREASLTKTISDYQMQLGELDRKGIEQQDLVRNAKSLEQNYLLYVQKREEARISDALDQRRMVNVAIVQPPTFPRLPARSPWMYPLMGVMLALLVTSGMVFAFEYTDHSFRTPEELQRTLDVPVLAAIPAGAPPSLFSSRGEREG
jgi:uncharacterized protein involved in exopolysaccharide biosynthesis